MLDRLRIEFTRSRPRRSNDNGLAETKNGAVVRKEFGYAHIPQRHAARFNIFCREYLNPFLNLQRPCLFATDKLDPNKPGRIKRVYRPEDAMTPLDKLASLPEANRQLREWTYPTFTDTAGLRSSLLGLIADRVGVLRRRVIQRACLWTSRRAFIEP